MPIKRWIIVLLAILAVPAYPAQKPRKVVMVIVPAVSLDDLASNDLPNFRMLMDSGAVGLMNSRTAGRVQEDAPVNTEDARRTPESGYLTIGAGSRAIAGSDAARAFDRNEITEGASAHIVLERLTLADPKASEVVHTRIVRIVRDNASVNHLVTVGMLGSALHRSGLKTAVVGNSDDERIHREAALVCMDEHGCVDLGDVGPDMSLRDPRAPLGIRTNQPRLVAEAARCIRLADLIVIEMGDTARLDRARLDLADDVFQRAKADVLKRTDAVLGRLLSTLDPKSTTLIVLSPYPSSEALGRSGTSLCPVIIRGPGIARCLLVSGSTRVPGIVTNTDIAPTILSALGVSAAPGLVGRPISSAPNGSPIRTLSELNDRMSRQTTSLPVLRQAMSAVIGLVLIVTALWWISPTGHALRRRLLPWLILMPTAVAPSMMLLALRPAGGQFGSWVCLIAVAGLLVGAVSILGRKPTTALMLMALGTSTLFFADLFTGDGMCRFSIMGYSIVEGARYYGIGNELMGALVGSGVIGIALLLGKTRAGPRTAGIVLALSLVVMAAAVGAPMLGANVGGAIAVVFAYGTAMAATAKRPFDPRRVIAIIGILAAIIAAFVVLDSLRGQQYESHLGKAIRGIGEGGFGTLWDIAARKLSMNWTLIRLSIWSRLLGVYMASGAVALFVGGAGSRLRPMPLHLRVAFSGAIGGTLAALAFNDSGVVSAATASVYPWALLLLTVLESEASK